MEVRAPNIKATSELVPGELFYHLGAGGSVLCIAGRWAGAEGAAELRIVPLVYPQSPQSVGVPIYETHFSGKALVLDNVTAEVLPKTYAPYSGAAIYGSSGSLFLPLTNGRSFSAGLLNLQTGEIVDHLVEASGFSHWRIVNVDDSDDVIWDAGASEDEQGQVG